jgi:hypothetical protein
MEVFADAPDYTPPRKIRIHMDSGAEIEIEGTKECLSFGKIHKQAFQHRGGYFLYT